MSEPTKHRITYHRLPDGRIFKIVLNRWIDPGEAIIHEIAWHRGTGAFPLDMLATLIGEIESLAKEEKLTFNQGMKFPGIPDLKFAFSNGAPATSISAEESAPRQKTPDDLRAELRAAIERSFPPDRFAEIFAGLPLESQRRFADRFLTSPPVRHFTRINRRKRR